MIRGLTHVAVRVTDLERSVAFYRDVVGLGEHFRLTDDVGRTMLVYLRVADGQFIELFPGGRGPYEDRASAGLVHLCLEVEDIQEAYRELTQRGAVSLHGHPICPGDHTWQFWIADPDGNPIEFHQFTAESLQRRSTANDTAR